MDTTTATPATGPVEMDLDSIVADLESEQAATTAATEAGAEPLAANEPEAGDAAQAPALEGEEAPDEAKESEPAAVPATVKVKVNGEEREVSLDEALKGYSRTEDYKAKTEKLAQDRTAVEGQYAERLKTIAAQFESFDPIVAEARTLDWAALARNDPAEYVAKRAALEQRQQMLGAVQAETQRIETEQTQATMRREYDALVSAMPQLADPDTAAKFDTELRTYLKSSMKLDDDTINSVTDHRFYLLADKARKFDAAEAAKASLPARKVIPVPTVKAVKAGSDAPKSTPRPPANASDSQYAEWAARRIAAE